MIPEKYSILMNSEIDGANGPAEREELEGYLAGHPEARRYFQDLKATLGAVAELGDMEPPADLHGRIMDAVDRKLANRRSDSVSTGHRSSPVGHRSTSGSWRELVFGKLRLGYALSAACGVMLGFLLHTLVPVDGIGRDLTALELFRGTVTSEAMEGWIPAQPVDLAQDGVQAQVNAFRQKDKVLVRIDMRSEQNARIDFTFSSSAQLKGILFLENGGYTTAAGGGNLAFQGAGRCRCEFLVEGSAATGLDLRLDSGLGGGPALTRRITWH